ncbi:enoyl-CoA hydratase/isomerase family protein [Nocardia salmonicida]|uniref:enoyl-CoA hydratase/isomerase family protein n=1 Tax=Nocardia salmonicida TaxID=53431 RepID=UPI00366A787C
MTNFDDYKDRYSNIVMEREDGILVMRFHSDGGELEWENSAHQEWPHAFFDVAMDAENHVVIMTGTGENFIARARHESWGPDRNTIPVRERIFHESKVLLRNLLDIPVPVIGIVNGPARIHAELPLLSDIVLASDTALFQDSVHFQTGGVPGDGVHVLWPMWIGPNRARHFLLTGREIDAGEALDLGLVAEVLPQDQLMDRALEIARRMTQRHMLTLRYSRLALTNGIRRVLNADLDEGLALEFMARAYLSNQGAYPFIRTPDPTQPE